MSSSAVHPRPTWWSALITALLAIACAFGALTTPSHAEESGFPDGFPRTAPTSPADEGYRVDFGGQAVTTRLFSVATGPSTDPLRAYCIESTVAARHDHELKLVEWTQFPGDNAFRTDARVRAKVAWIVRNTYPQVSIEDLRTAAGIPELTVKEAISATQAALWQLTDGLIATGVADAENPDVTQRVLALIGYLTGADNTGLEPGGGPVVGIQAPEQVGSAGQLVGPIRITANVATVSADPIGYPIVDGNQNPVDVAAIPTGVDLYLQVPAQEPAGSVTLKITASGAQYVGSLLISAHERTQTIVIVDSESVSVQAEAVVRWNSAPTPTPSPSVTPTPSPSDTPTPTPTQTPRPRQLPKTGN